MAMLFETDDKIKTNMINSFANIAIKHSLIQPASKKYWPRVARVITSNFIFCVTDHFGKFVVQFFIENCAEPDELDHFVDLFVNEKRALESNVDADMVRNKLSGELCKRNLAEQARRLSGAPRSQSPRRRSAPHTAASDVWSLWRPTKTGSGGK